MRICIHHLVYHIIYKTYSRCVFELHQGHITNCWTSNALHAVARVVSSTLKFAFALLISIGYTQNERNNTDVS